MLVDSFIKEDEDFVSGKNLSPAPPTCNSFMSLGSTTEPPTCDQKNGLYSAYLLFSSSTKSKTHTECRIHHIRGCPFHLFFFFFSSRICVFRGFLTMDQQWILIIP